MASDLSALMAMGAAIIAVVFAVLLAIYVYSAIALMAIARKTNTPNGWLAWIPIANIYLMTQIGKLPGWYTLVVLLAMIPIVGGIALMAAMVYFWWKIAEARSKPGWYGILMIIPPVNFVIMGIIAWSD